MIWVVTVAVTGNYGGVVAQSTAPSAGCTTSLIALAPCAGYVTSNVTTSPPSQSCCTALSSVVKNNANCLCLLFTNNNPLGFPINQTRALTLPGACKVTTPSISQCKAAGAPAPSSSAGAPAPSLFTGVGVPAPSASAVSSNSAPTGSVPSSSPEPETSIPPAVIPSARSPTSSVGGISPTESEHPKTSAGAHLTSSAIISMMVGLVIVSIAW
ncbi:hypothetical protein SUGI_0684930 [Cryptomeria japonica]|nr:hypothetical protein SUGI_0684930 [Cryptomeria japonica]